MIIDDTAGYTIYVSVIYVNSFGAMVIGRRTGIIFNNQMDNFITKAADLNLSVAANHIRPGKRPMSSMTPSLFINSNGEVILTIGASGGTRIITSSAYVIYIFFLTTIIHILSAQEWINLGKGIRRLGNSMPALAQTIPLPLLRSINIHSTLISKDILCPYLVISLAIPIV